MQLNKNKRSARIHHQKILRGMALLIVCAVAYYVHLLGSLDLAADNSDVGVLPSKQNRAAETTNNTTQNKPVVEKTEITEPASTNEAEQKQNARKNDNDAQPTPGDEPADKTTGTQKVELPGGIPSAKALLTIKPPFEDKDLIYLYPEGSESKPLIESPNTIVTGYFRVRSKHKSGNYDTWMRNMLSLQDAMVIFTEPDMVDQVKQLREHAVNRTVIVPMGLYDLPIGKLYSDEFWQDQLDRDPEKKIHKSYPLFWIWLSKSWCVMEAIKMNLFQSDLFLWSDIGCFRDSVYNSRTLILHRDEVPANEMLQMAHTNPNPPAEELYNDKYKQRKHFYHSGSQFVAYKDTWVTFHEYFLETIDRFLEKKMIIVEDQAILQSVCLTHPEICAYAHFRDVKDNRYFGLRRILHHGHEKDYWRHAPGTKI